MTFAFAERLTLVGVHEECVEFGIVLNDIFSEDFFKRVARGFRVGVIAERRRTVVAVVAALGVGVGGTERDGRHRVGIPLQTEC